MDKNAIKKYAVWAREELIKRVSTKAEEYGISKENTVSADAEAVNGHLLTKTEITQRQALISKIKAEGYEQVMEEVAYTWFNRFIALRFMEVNNYLPTHIRVFTDEQGSFDPQILTEAIHLELDGLNRDKVIVLKQENKTEELFKYLIITLCNALSSILPGMFQRIDHYTELLFPDNILRKGSVIEQMVTLIPEEDWKDAVQIIGWLYQYYNSVPKDKVFENLKKNIKIRKEDIPAATQLFTPDWIVRYMVENSLGRLWVEGHPNEELKSNWKYYLDEAKQEADVEAQLAQLREEHKQIKPENIKVIDPCMGSGHILVYAFDVLMQIYQSTGWDQRDAARSILTNNLYGLDIDDRAAQLAYFAVMMKARQYDRRIFTRGVQPPVYAIVESNHLDTSTVEYFTNNDPQLKKDMSTLMSELRDAKEYGSILNISQVDFSALIARIEEVQNDISIFRENVLNDIAPLIHVAEVMAQKYDAVVTNPPYMGSSGMSAKLSDYVKAHYPDSKSDLFAVFMEHCGQMTGRNRYQAMITQHAWMFLSSFEKLRSKLLQKDTVNMVHLGARAFEEIGGEVVQTTSFVLRNSHIKDYKGVYCRMVEPTTQNGKEDMFLAGKNRYESVQDNFSKIPGSPIAYWVSEAFTNMFAAPLLYEYSISDGQNVTSDNNRFVRFFWEVTNDSIGKHQKWRLYAKGGGYRKWYGNLVDVVDWSPSAIKFYHKESSARVLPEYLWYRKGITWGLITSNLPSFRLLPEYATFDKGGSSIFLKDDKNYYYTIGLLNSKVFFCVATVLNATLNFQVKDIRSMPIVFEQQNIVELLVRNNEGISKIDWDCFETSWDFKRHPLLIYGYENDYGMVNGEYTSKVPELQYDVEKNIFELEKDEPKRPHNCTIENCFYAWNQHCNVQFNTLKANEEELNRIFIDIYGLQDELTPEVENKDVTVRKADLRRDIKSLISYAVGCMFGRYSLDVGGLVYAGGNFNSKYCRWISQFGDKANENIDENGGLIHGGWAGSSMWKYDGVRKDGKWILSSFPPDTDNIIPICDDEYFEDDITGRFVKWVETVYGKDTLEENLRYIADALGGKGSAREVIRNYFINDFYADHLKTYQKRPIYWLFDSGKKGGFKALIYMHRYQPDTIARMRTDYVHEQQARYRTAIADLEHRISMADTAERVKLNKQLEKVRDQDAELRTYEEKIHHLADQMIRIDLDDGVKHNYEIFKDVLAPIK